MLDGLSDGELLERHDEQAVLAATLDRADSGNGSLVIVEGPAGIGKSRLLRSARSMGADRGLVVGGAVGGSLEQEFSLGAVRQLFEPLVERYGSADGLFDGAAAVAAPLFGRRSAADSGDEAPGVILHGLYWLLAGLIDAAGPTVLICDDVHWFDAPSVRYLAYVANRMSDLALTVVVGTRPPQPGADGELLSRMINHQEAVHIHPAALSADAVSTIVHRSLDAKPEPSFCDAVSRASGGNPFLVGELMRSVRATGVSPDAASADRVTEAVAGSSVLARIGRLPPVALELARAVAVLGADAHVRHAAAMAGIDLDEAATAADLLLRAEILGPGRPLTFVHPLVRTAVYNDLLPGDRSRRHWRAAEVLRAEQTSSDRIAPHMMATEPAHDRRAVEVLVDSASIAMAEGGTDIAIDQLRRALDEPPPRDMRGDIVLLLGIAEALLIDPRAIDHLGEAMDALSDPASRLELATARALALCVEGRAPDAVEALEALEPEVADDPMLRLQLLAAIVEVGMTGPTAAPLVQEQMAELVATVTPDAAVPPGVLAVCSFAGCFTGAPAPDMVTMARRSLATVDTRDGMLPIWFHLAVTALVMADHDSEAAAVVDPSLNAARRLGSPGHVGPSLFIRAMIALRAGDLDDAEADALEALELGRHGRLGFLLPGVVAILVDVYRERDELDRADALLEQEHLAASDADFVYGLFLFLARARLRGAQGRWDLAFVDLERGSALATVMGCRAPALFCWQANMAFALLRSEQRDGAQKLACDALAEAESFGAPRAIAEAMRVVAWADETRSELAIEAERRFEALGSSLEQARTMLTRAVSPPEAGTPAEPELLSQGLRLAERCGAARLVTIARELLRALGARPRHRPVSGVDALTASERRVASLAAAGRTNKQIAQELFVTVKTVETHMSHTFQKLEISSRGELAEAMAG